MAWNVDTATEWGRATGLLGANETATGGLLVERANAAGAIGMLDAASKAVDTGTSVANTLPQSMQNYVAGSVQNPVLPNNTQVVPQTMQVQQGELVNFNPISAPNAVQQRTPVTTNIGPAATVNTANILLDPQTGLQYIRDASGQYQPVLIGNQTPQAVAQQGQVSELATVQGQLKKLYADAQPGEIPEWARGAVQAANEVSAARKIGNSSIAVGAISDSIQRSAINIAATDAASYFNMDMANLTNRQQTELENVRLRQQSLLTDTAASNAALQFNATSQVQIDQFKASLVTTIESQNKTRIAAVEQFNAAAANSMATAEAELDFRSASFNEQMAATIDQFNSEMQYQVKTFNATNGLAVDQSNATWRRTINTSNTASVNAANQINASNAFNLSSYAMNAIWQQLRDESAWLYQSSESAADRALRLSLAANDFQYRQQLQGQQNDWASDQALWQGVGEFVSNWLSS